MRALTLTFVALSALAAGCFNPEYGTPGFYCHPEDSPACPDGQECINGRCIGGTGGGGGFDMGSGIVPKTGMYTGAKLDPMLNSETDCTDTMLEGNDTIATAITGLTMQLNLAIDQPSSKLQMLAICPKGDNPKADGHDVDFYEFDVSANASAVVEIFYDVKYGDLDVGIFKPDGSLVKGDGTAVTDGCVAATLPAGSYYVGVGGANNMDSNRYDMRIRLYSTPHQCSGTTTPVDMAF
jgi:hypothetical protein